MIKSAKVKKGRIDLKWKKAKGAIRYEIQISTDKSFRKAESISVKKEKAALKGLKKGRKYYIRIRGFASIWCGKWSKKKAVIAK